VAPRVNEVSADKAEAMHEDKGNGAMAEAGMKLSHSEVFPFRILK
jgi:hypothetical protein